MLSRPKATESEEDLLKLQNQFLKGDLKPAVSVLRADKRKADKQESIASGSTLNRPGTSESSQKRVKFKLNDDIGNDSDSLIDATDVVLSDIKEKDTSCSIISLPKLEKVPFPPTFQLDEGILEAENTDKKPRSLFAQQMMKKKQLKALRSSRDKIFPKIEKFSGHKSFIVDGSGLNDQNGNGSAIAQQIHEENISKLQNLSEDEILQERQKLLSALDPKLIEFLKSRRQKARNDSQELKSLPVDDHDEIQNIDSMEVTASKSDDSESQNIGTMDDISELPAGLSKNQQEKRLETESMDIDISKTVRSDDDLPIKLSEAKKWLHMDKVEKDKLLWTTSLPEPKPVESKTGYVARFNFEGLLEAQDSDIPTHFGLHHHGQDPELPGYTLEELFIYSRSSIPQQRVLAFQIITNIINKAQEGLYDACLVNPLLPQLLDAGIILLIRWAMDDKIEAVIDAAIEALHAILVNKADEFCLDRVFSWYRGKESPFLMPRDTVETSEEDQQKQKKEEGELKDADLIKLDVIKGLLRVDTLPRLRYILEVSRPAAPVVINILEILIRMARHSFDVATSVLNHPRLISTIVHEFLPRNWRTIEGGAKASSVAYGAPVFQAIKLLRILAICGRRFASTLINKYQIMDILMCYVLVDPSEMGIPTVEAIKLSLESYRTWRIFLSYGLACESYLDGYPVLMRQLQYFQTISVNMNVIKNQYNYDLGACFFGIFEANISIAAIHSKLKAELVFRNPSEIDDVGTKENIAPAVVSWSHVAGLLQPFTLLLKKWLWELTKTDIITNSSLNAIGSCFNVLTEYYKAITDQPKFQAVEVLNGIEELVKSAVIPFLHSRTCQNLFSKLKEFSALLVKDKPGFERDPATLPSFGTIMWNGNVLPLLHEQAPFHFFTSLCHFCNEICKIHRGIISKVGELILLNPSVLQYLEKLILLSSPQIENQYFIKYEVQFLYFLISLSSFMDCQQIYMFHTIAIKMMAWFQVGDEHLALDLANSVIFNPNFLPEQNELISGLSALKISRKIYLESVSEQPTEDSCIRLLSKSVTSLPSIKNSYLKCFSSAIENFDRKTREKNPLEISYFVIPSFPHTILKEDWFFLPMSQLYLKNRKITLPTDLVNDELLTQMIPIATSCLQWLYILKNWRTKLIDSLPLNSNYCYLAAVFLTGNDLFLDVNIHSYLQALYLLMFDNNRSKLFTDKVTVLGFTAFRDFYLHLLDQYEAVSYGDKLFGAFVIMPLQQLNDKQLRMDFWGEHICILRTLRIPLNQVLDVEYYLQPLEDDVSLIGSYFQSALNRYITPIFSPLMYLVAVHHVHNFLFRKDDKYLKLRKGMFQRLEATKNQIVKDHFINYGGPNANLEIGFAVVDVDDEKRAFIDTMRK